MARIITGDELKRQAVRAGKFRRRLCLAPLMNFLSHDPMGSIAALYGLRRTGKTTMLFQAALNSGRIDECAYVMVNKEEDLGEVYDAVAEITEKNGITAVFIDEITSADNFLNLANLFSDMTAMNGIHVVITGTDSLGIHIAEKDILFDRIKTLIHTTCIPFCEHSMLTGTTDIDSYIECGGVLSDIDDFSRYISGSIIRNIGNTYLRSGCAGHLARLVRQGTLDSAINRILNHEAGKFLVEILKRPPAFPDIRMGYRLLTPKEKKILRELLGVDNAREHLEKKSVDLLFPGDISDITQKELVELNHFFIELDFVIPRLVATPETFVHLESRKMMKLHNDPSQILMSGDGNHVVDLSWAFTQPGLRWSQVSLILGAFGERFRQYESITRKFGLHAKGKILEDIVITEIWNRAQEESSIFTYKTINGEIDIVVVLPENRFDIWEVKHSSRKSLEHAKHITNPEFLVELSANFGQLRHAGVLYNGDDDSFACNIVYNKSFSPLSEVRFQNVAGFLLDNPYGPWPVEKFKPKYMAECIHNATSPKPWRKICDSRE